MDAVIATYRLRHSVISSLGGIANKAFATFRKFLARRRAARALDANWRLLRAEYGNALPVELPSQPDNPLLPPLAVASLFAHRKDTL